METLPLITLLFSLVASGAFIWLTIRGFKKSVLWGFAIMLLSPFSAIYFGIYYWEKQKEPFLLYTTTFTAMIALSIYMFTTMGGMEAVRLAAGLQQEIISGTFKENMNSGFKRANYSFEGNVAEEGMFQQDPAFLNAEKASNTTGEVESQPETASHADKPAAEDKEPARYRLTYIPIKLSELDKHVGATAKITRKNAQEKEYIITGTSPRHIEVAQRSRNGKFSFHFKNSDIEKVRVLINEAY